MLFYRGKQRILDSNGNPVSGALANFYLTGSSTRANTYQDSSLGTPHSNPVEADSAGFLPPIYLDSGVTYRCEITDSLGGSLPDGIVDPVLQAAFTQQSIGEVLYPISTEETIHSAIPDNYAYPAGDPRRYNSSNSAVLVNLRSYAEDDGFYSAMGFIPQNLKADIRDGTSTDDLTSYIQDALDAAASDAVKGVRLRGGLFPIGSSTLTVGSNIQLVGAGMGFGSYTSTVLKYTGSGVAIEVDGYYSRLADFALKQAGTGTIGIYVPATQFMMERVTVMPDITTGFSTSAYQSRTDATVFTHALKRCYIYGNTVGVNFPRGNNFILDGCFIESNGTNVLVANVSAVTNFIICNGCVIEQFGDGRAAESLTGVSVDLHDTGGVGNAVIRDSYFEVDGAGVAGASGQLAVNIRKCDGLTIEGNYMYGGGQAVKFINAQANAKAVRIAGNRFSSLNGYAVAEVAGSSVEMGINSLAGGGSLGVINRALTLTPTSVTEGGSGTVTYQVTSFNRRGNEVEFTAKITVTSTATTASTKGTSYLTLANPMPTPSEEGTFQISSTEAAQSVSGQGLISTNSRLYLPTWSAANQNIIIKGRYRAAQV